MIIAIGTGRRLPIRSQKPRSAKTKTNGNINCFLPSLWFHYKNGGSVLVTSQAQLTLTDGDKRQILFAIALLVGLADVAFGQTPPALEIAPSGKLRVGMIAITVLGGVAEPVGRFIGQKLGASVEPVMYPNPEAYLQSFGKK